MLCMDVPFSWGPGPSQSSVPHRSLERTATALSESRPRGPPTPDYSKSQGTRRQAGVQGTAHAAACRSVAVAPEVRLPLGPGPPPTRSHQPTPADRVRGAGDRMPWNADRMRGISDRTPVESVIEWASNTQAEALRLAGGRKPRRWRRRSAPPSSSGASQPRRSHHVGRWTALRSTGDIRKVSLWLGSISSTALSSPPVVVLREGPATIDRPLDLL